MKRCAKCGVKANWSSADCPICFGQLERLFPSDATACSPVFPKMPIGAALEFADSGESTGGIMTHEALETLAAAYRDVLRILKDPVAVHINMLRGTIAWTPEHLRHVLGDSQ